MKEIKATAKVRAKAKVAKKKPTKLYGYLPNAGVFIEQDPNEDGDKDPGDIFV